MKGYKIYLVGFILLLYLSFPTQGTNINVRKQDDKADINIVPLLTESNSVVYEWNRTWGGGNYDSAQGVATDSSGNIFLAGFTESFGAGGRDMILVKYGGKSVQQWNRTWGGGSGDSGWGVAADSSGNIYLVGLTHSFGAGSRDMVLVKYDGNGVQQWNRTWGGGSGDSGWGVAADSSGNIFLAGSTSSFGTGSSDMVLVKYDGSGVQQWNRTWGGSESDDSYGVAVDSSSNIYLAGRTYSFGAGNIDMVLVKYNENGVQQWNRTWGGSESDVGFGAVVDSSGNIYLAGSTPSFGAGSSDMVLVKYNGNGAQQWNRTWGGSSGDDGWGVVTDSLGNIYLAGVTDSFGAGSSDMVLVKLVDNGSLERPPPDIIKMIVIIVSIVSVVGVGLVITFFIKKFRNN